MIFIRLPVILDRINTLVRYFVHPGYNSSNLYSFIRRAHIFITTHPLIMFFVLLSFLFVALRLLRRLLS